MVVAVPVRVTVPLKKIIMLEPIPLPGPIGACTATLMPVCTIY